MEGPEDDERRGLRGGRRQEQSLGECQAPRWDIQAGGERAGGRWDKQEATNQGQGLAGFGAPAAGKSAVSPQAQPVAGTLQIK